MGGVAVTLNGQRREIAAGTRLVELLESMGVDVKRIAVERNRVVVPRKDHAGVTLDDGDELEVVQFVGGG